ncbi:N-acetyltransferase family protein [Fredinandcohnia sp. 179-A 10B2 NHS]|uniref:GNAT family N-acetyltransferase n=1 Tax=Fredinandcohnia sp. 179-A 10B2 NHS TaxID=3235176 RepID=UPI00399F8963
MLIRQIKVSDAKEFIELSSIVDDSGYMLYEPGERETTPEQQEKMIERVLGEKNSTILVAETEGKLVGFLCVFGGGVRRNRHSGYIVLGVQGEYNGKGIATKLFKEMFVWAKQVGLSRLELTVIKDNVKAFNLYRKMGFVLEGEKVHSLVIDGVPTNEYYLYRLL